VQQRLLYNCFWDFKLGAAFSQQWFLRFHNRKPFCVSYLHLLQSQEDLLLQHITCIIYLCVSIDIHSVNQAAYGTPEQSEKHLENMME